ncbi:MAG: ATP-binding cassette domain-containing protein [Actinobacteria bacterium]|nr:ATP-binding cassette domain-containing protein [Actinomycetota bacterium]
MTIALKFDDVCVSYGASRRNAGVDALMNVNLTIDSGERVAVVGRSGAGKSTIAKLACGLTKPSSGCVSVFGTDASRASRRELRRLRHRMHLVFQDPYQSLHPGLRVGDLVKEPLLITGRGRTTKSAVPDALARVGLTPPSQFMDRAPATLSGGQRQRVAIARALVARPELILADEPTSMLDASLRATIANLLLELQAEQNAALIFITHDLALARQVANRIVVLSEGRVVEDRPTEELLSDPEHVETRKLLAAARQQPKEM